MDKTSFSSCTNISAVLKVAVKDKNFTAPRIVAVVIYYHCKQEKRNIKGLGAYYAAYNCTNRIDTYVKWTLTIVDWLAVRLATEL